MTIESLRKLTYVNERRRAALQRIVEHYDMRSDMYTNDADLAECLAEIARRALEPKP